MRLGLSVLDGSISRMAGSRQEVYRSVLLGIWLQPPLWALLLVKTYQGSRTLSYVCIRVYASF